MKKKIIFLILSTFLLQLYSQQKGWSSVAESRHYDLTGNYSLTISDTVESGNHLYQVILSSKDSVMIVDENTCANDMKFFPGYDGIDFEDYFLVGYYEGSYRYKLFEKKTGRKILEYETSNGVPVFNIEQQLLLYNTENNEPPLYGDVYMFDMKNDRKYMLNHFIEDGLNEGTLWLDIIHWFDSFEIIESTSDKIKLLFYGCYRPIFDHDGELSDTEDSEFTISINRNK